MNKQELFNELASMWEQFEGFHNKTTKKSDVDARKTLREMKKRMGDYVKASVEEGKGK